MKTLVYNKRAKVFLFKIVIVSFIFLFFAAFFTLLGISLFSKEYKTTSAEISDKTTVILDAGHGGIDGGAEVNGIFEKDLNLRVADNISDFLSLCNVECVMTRTDDESLSDAEAQRKKQSDLLNRVKIAREYENPVFVSIHMNKFPIEKYSGLQVFYSKNNSASQTLAKTIQDNVKNYLQSENNRQIKESGTSIYILDRLECPAVLVECGFMSNNEELQNLSNDEYRRKLSFVISESILQFLKSEDL